jgi:dCMP deaminase
MRPTIEETMLEIAQVLAKRGTCAKKQVGAVITDAHGIILSTGYNGQPRGHKHCDVMFPCEAYLDANLSCKAIHAETNALLRCPDIEKANIIYITEKPCMKCEMLIQNTNIQRIVYLDENGNIVDDILDWPY